MRSLGKLDLVYAQIRNDATARRTSYAREVVAKSTIEKGRQMRGDVQERHMGGIITMWGTAKLNGENKLECFIDSNKMDAEHENADNRY
ncbi:hypothetical protein Trco_003346 [Trichoderma cornu-damae]|uniref:Uncharacterized protein n=1 Tax=Trichoderma cornu-damae TaxID=654480 RepID=A0A9P8QQR3_9HYPO|nr:hypothetical protein Trco_003346 [Trichoderma cornu-damae]